MELESLRIQNYRSLEDVRLENLGRINVLVGRNNAGKSAIVNALLDFGEILRQNSSGDQMIKSVDLHSRMPSRNDALFFKIDLEFQLNKREHKDVLTFILNQTNQNIQHKMHDYLNDSHAFRKIKFNFWVDPQNSKRILLKSLGLTAYDGAWVEAVEETTVRGPLELQFINFMVIAQNATSLDWNVSWMRNQGPSTFSYLSAPEFRLIDTFGFQPYNTWFNSLQTYFSNAFFFSAIRQSDELHSAKETNALEANGRNLAGRLHTLRSNGEPVFRSIERFVQNALPDLGLLRSRIDAANTFVAFEQTESNFFTRLHEMGGGLEQLLLVATALRTTDASHPLFLEEPESHLHPGAQRYLLEQLAADGRQVFVTTHSPIFVNTLGDHHRTYTVRREGPTTRVSSATNPADLAEGLAELGSRPSDVLFADAVLFLEGPTDGPVFTAWAKTLGHDLERGNVKILTTGGGEMAGRDAPIRSEVIEGLASGLRVPHLFVIDRDHRPQAEVDKLEARLGERLHVLERRELENYLLDPQAILETLKSLPSGNAAVDAKRQAATAADIEQLIQQHADKLEGMVIVKRVRQALGRLEGGLLDRDGVEALIPYALEPDFPNRVTAVVSARILPRIEEKAIAEIIEVELNAHREVWQNRATRAQIAPGAEILEGVFGEFGAKFKKKKHGLLIAERMQPREIPPEITMLVARAARLASEAGG